MADSTIDATAQAATGNGDVVKHVESSESQAPATTETAPKPHERSETASQEDQERAVGITAYVSPDAPGFSCIVKQRYTDFLVNEILPTGEVLHLTEIARPPEREEKQTRGAYGREKRDQASNGAEKTEEDEVKITTGEEGGRKRPAEDVEDGDGQDGVVSKRVKVEERAGNGAPTQEAAAANETSEDLSTVISDEDRNALISIFGEPTTNKTIRLYCDVRKYPKRKPRDHVTIKSEVITEKAKRTEAHIAVRRIFESKLETATLQDTPGAISIRASPPQGGGDSRGRTDVRDGQRGGRQKGRVAWEDLGGEYLHFTLYKENKDTMEVLYFLASKLKVKIGNFAFAGTKDRRGVTVQRVSALRIRKEQLMGLTDSARGWKLGGFEYKKRGLNLGQLTGNEFLLTLRDAQLHGETASTLEERLGKLRSAVEKAARDFSEGGFINYYGLQRFGSYGTGTHTTGMKMIQGDLEGAVNGVLAYKEELLPEHQDPSGEVKAPREDIERADGLRIWHTTGNSRKALDKIPRRFQAEVSMITYLGRRGKRNEPIQNRDWQGALMSIQRNLRMMYVHAYQGFIWNTASGKRRELYGDKVVEGDLVIVGEKDEPKDEKEQAEVDQDGEPVIRPTGEDAAAPDDPFTRARPLSKEDVASGKYNIFDLVLPLPGFDVVYPKNEIGKFYEELMGSEAGGRLDPHSMRRSWKDASLSGGYRKMMARPGGLEVSVKAYGGDLEQMVETDAEKVEKKEMGIPSGVDLASTNAVGGGDKFAVVLKMQLGSSQYATMALRELTKGGATTYTTEFAAAR